MRLLKIGTHVKIKINFFSIRPGQRGIIKRVYMANEYDDSPYLVMFPKFPKGVWLNRNEFIVVKKKKRKEVKQ